MAASSETAAAAAAAEAEEGNAGDTAKWMDEGLQERRRRCLEWCLDNGFEYVEADCRDSHTGITVFGEAACFDPPGFGLSPKPLPQPAKMLVIALPLLTTVVCANCFQLPHLHPQRWCPSDC